MFAWRALHAPLERSLLHVLSWLLMLAAAVGLCSVLKGSDLSAGLVAATGKSGGKFTPPSGATTLSSLQRPRPRQLTGPARRASSRSRTLHLVSHRSRARDPKAKAQALDARFVRELKHLEAQADQVPLIGARHIFYDLPSQLLDDPKWARHLPDTHGRGYWFWKAALVNLLLDNGTIVDGDAVIWADGDIGQKGTLLGKQEDWEKAMKVTWSPEGLDFLIAHQGACEFHWTKGDIFKKFEVAWDTPQYGLQHQPKANMWLMKVNAKTRRLLRLWEDLMADYHLVSDEPSVAANPPGFEENRHDQSLLSMLLSASLVDRGVCLPKAKHPIPDWTPTLHPVYGIEDLRAQMGRIPHSAFLKKKR